MILIPVLAGQSKFARSEIILYPPKQQIKHKEYAEDIIGLKNLIMNQGDRMYLLDQVDPISYTQN